jgi:acyl-CoA synthetase (AMP-forming)/AMP-acid ligase II
MDLMLACLCIGATVIAGNSPQPDEIWQLVEQHAATGFSWMPGDSSVFSHPAAKRLGHRIERVAHQAAIESEETFELMAAVMPNVRYAGSYGLSEAGAFVTRTLSEDELRRPGTVGRPSVGCDVAVLGDDGQHSSVGEVGELCVRGPSVMLGYFARPHDTAAALSGGWLHTGDLASLDGDGYLYFMGRSKDMVKSGGENVYCTEVERILEEHLGVVEAIVFGVPDARWGETVKAVIVADATAHPSVQELDGWCLERLGAFKRPRWYEFAAQDDIPRSTFRKPAKNILRSQHDAAQSMRAPERTRAGRGQ